MKHTPGPWKIGMRPGPIVYGPMGEQVCNMRAPLLIEEENLANARLIAAAPAMLEALKDAIYHLEKLYIASTDHDHRAVKTLLDARAAISAAEGE